VRIVSLLPSATEMCFALGLEDQLGAVTFECDFPEAARRLPHATTSALEAVTDPGEIDRLVRESMESGQPIYRLDEDLVRTIDPDLVIAQDLCRVCAVPSGQVEIALAKIGHRARVLSLDPSTVSEVLAGLVAVADAAGVRERGELLVADLEERMRRVAHNPPPIRKRVLTLEWSDPPFVGGHWVPEMVAIAGGLDVLGALGARSRTVSWGEIDETEFDVVVFMPCGYDLAAAVAEGRTLLGRPELGGAELFAVDATAYFSRPGPRIVEGIEVLAWALDPSKPVPPDGRIERLR